MLFKHTRLALCLLAAELFFLQPGAAREATATAPTSTVNVTTGEIRQRMKDFEDAWNRGDVAAVKSQYHSSMFAIHNPDYLDFAGYMHLVDEFMAENKRQRLSIDLHTIRPLGDDYAVANGRAYSVSKEGRDAGSLFTVIYMRADGQWKFVYGHM